MFRGADVTAKLHHLKKILFNLTFYPLFIIVTVGMFSILVLPALLIWLVIGERPAMRITRWLIVVYGVIVCRGLTFPFVKIKFEDSEPDARLPACIYVCNHRSSSDAFLMAFLKRELIQVVNNWPFKIPILGWVARFSGYLSIRTMPFEEFLKKGKKLLAEGVSIVTFPEGSRSLDQNLRQFNGAVFRLAQIAQVPIVPICLSGNQMVPEKGSNILHPGNIRISKLKTFKWEYFKDWTPFKLKNAARETIQNKVNELEPVNAN